MELEKLQQVIVVGGFGLMFLAPVIYWVLVLFGVIDGPGGLSMKKKPHSMLDEEKDSLSEYEHEIRPYNGTSDSGMLRGGSDAFSKSPRKPSPTRAGIQAGSAIALLG
ncbi:hypothetical protein TK90_2735 (plasmid) [Thioalkalivibrio sp. K90mix]|uniref:hypothetical protein n=1 Tax=Thioalkalivibrio sp. (strain K90mix) TaxID=396595 RepID=UPI000195A55E|nr:hypothetical protein [Thioalkalivibrio sp. K90mix]ADC73221.1 hypothetical protein TK90_2735 [Thioalkalivibrio sp. K90mix]